MNQSFSINKMIRSFKYAWQGMKAVARHEQNFKIHLVAAFCALLLAALFKVSGIEIVLIVICIVAVMGMEIMNTAIEKLCDFISPEKKTAIKRIKDLSAAAVFIISIGALIVGLIIFIPRIIALL